MYKFKKGDLVQHVPSGCIVPYVDGCEGFSVIFRNSTSREPVLKWDNCRPAPDYSKLIEAAKAISDLYKNHYANYKMIDCKFPKLLRDMGNAIADLESSKEPEYKWLARNFESPRGWFFTKRPTHEDAWLSKGDARAKNITPPAFLKPGQLWERLGAVQPDMFNTERIGIGSNKVYQWQGHWWRLVEDHSLTCENCRHCLSIKFSNGDFVKFYCNVTDKTHPQYDQPGCKWEAKDE